MVCQACGRPGQTQSATLYQNIGLLVALRYRTLKGSFCTACLTHYFWEYTLITLALGWWGIVSVFLTPFILINNLFFFLRAQVRHSPPPGTLPLPAATTLPNACPHCQALQSTAVGLSRSVWASLIVSGLLLVWAGYLCSELIQNRTSSDNWMAVGLFVGINLLVGLCLLMLIRHPLRQCRECQLIWSESIP